MPSERLIALLRHVRAPETDMTWRGVAAALGPGLAVVMGGVVAAVGAVDIRNFRWVRDRERAEGEAIFRERGASPFAGGKRPLYTRPM